MKKISDEVGISINELKGYTYLEGVQLYIEDTWTTVDGMLVKKVKIRANEYIYEAVAIEVKLSENSPFTRNQKVYIEKLKRGESEFKLRSRKFERDFEIEQNDTIKLKSYLKIEGQGTSDNIFKIKSIYNESK